MLTSSTTALKKAAAVLKLQPLVLAGGSSRLDGPDPRGRAPQTRAAGGYSQPLVAAGQAIAAWPQRRPESCLLPGRASPPLFRQGRRDVAGDAGSPPGSAVAAAPRRQVVLRAIR